MSYNGTGTFNINTAGQPVVTGTTITSTAFNLLTTDLATGLTTALTKDGQTTPTANIPMGTYKITGLGAGSATTDAAQYGQLQANATTIATVTGTDTLVGTLAPALTAYATGNLFSFVAVNTNTGATTININSLGAKNVTKQGSTALIAGDIVSGQVYLIEYDGTRFQLLNPTNVGVSLSTANTFTATQTFNGSSSTFALTILDANETVNVVASAPSSTTNFYIQSGGVQYYTTNAANNWTLNIAFSSGTSLNTALSTGQSVTFTLVTTQGTTAYYNSAVTIDGTSVTPKWISGAPTAGNASGLDVYRGSIIKTASATYTVIMSLTQFKT